MTRVSLTTFLVSAVVFTFCLAAVEASLWERLTRHKREWIIPPQKLTENTDYTKREFIAKIRSSFEEKNTKNLRYSLKGVGADAPPINLFTVDPVTGFVKINGILDREEISLYNLSGIARYLDGSFAEKDIDFQVKVLDLNDNPPIFHPVPAGAVDELSPAGTTVMKVSATDADEPDNKNSMIAYSIVSQDPPGDMFYMGADGSVIVKRNTLDREVHDQYVLVVKGADLNGEPGGNVGTGTVTINIGDVNDNLPTLEKTEYSGEIMENKEGIEVMRLKAFDLDIERTDNWIAVYEITTGNEAGYFSIKTDPKTNEGILMLDKAVDYEDVKNLDLGISVRNKAEFHYTITGGSTTSVSVGGGSAGGGGGGGGGGGVGSGGAGGSGGGSFSTTTTTTTKLKTYPVKISVLNEPEGPRFDPKVKAIHISEETVDITKVISTYQAIDSDTGKPAENVRYAKVLDPDSWLTIDEKTAEIKLNKKPDRESTYLVNGTYYAKIICITQDMPSKTATGTVAIQVEDFNDHCPKLTSHLQTMCTDTDAIIVTAEDKDAFPNSAPFTFTVIPEGTKGKWTAEHRNDTSAILRSHGLWPGSYEVTVEVHDQQGLACPDLQRVVVEVCTCEDGKMCGKVGAKGVRTKGSELGPAALGLLLLGLLLLLLIPLLLLFCHCGGAGVAGDFLKMPFDTKSHLIAYHTEGQGENTDVPLIDIGDAGRLATLDGKMISVGTGVKTAAGMAAGGGMAVCGGMYGADHWSTMKEDYLGNGTMVNDVFRSGTWTASQGHSTIESGGAYEGIALPEVFLGQYYAQKAVHAAESHVPKDNLLVYDYEGQGSPAGSVGCCSLLESDNDLQFLDDLGPKFKTLAELCGGKKIEAEFKPAVSLATAAGSLAAASSSVVTASSVVSAAARPTPAPRVLPQPQPQPQPSSMVSTHTERTVVREASEHSGTLRQGGTSTAQGQTFVLQGQQPVYYTTAQPMHYIVQPQVQNTVLLAETQPNTNLQGMILVNGASSVAPQGLVLNSGATQGQGMVLVQNSGAVGQTMRVGTLPRAQGVMLVDGQIPVGSNTVLQGGTLKQGVISGSQGVMLVDGQIPIGSNTVLQGGTLKKGVISGSQGVMLVDGQIPVGSNTVLQGGTLKQGVISGSQGVLLLQEQGGKGVQLVQGSAGLANVSLPSGGYTTTQRVTYTSGSDALNGSTLTTSLTPGSQKVLVQEKKVVTTKSVTE